MVEKNNTSKFERNENFNLRLNVDKKSLCDCYSYLASRDLDMKDVIRSFIHSFNDSYDVQSSLNGFCARQWVTAYEKSILQGRYSFVSYLLNNDDFYLFWSCLHHIKKSNGVNELNNLIASDDIEDLEEPFFTVVSMWRAYCETFLLSNDSETFWREAYEVFRLAHKFSRIENGEALIEKDS